MSELSDEQQGPVRSAFASGKAEYEAFWSCRRGALAKYLYSA